VSFLNKLVFLSLLISSSYSYAQSVNKTAVAELEQVIADFSDAIIKKDEAKFTNLFYSKTIPWLGVNTKIPKGDTPSKDGLLYATHLGFIGWIASSTDQMEEKFWDIDIKTDGEIASIYFKYSFHINDYKANWGDEAWDLIKTADGWKIVSVLFSATYNPEPPKEK
jgi:ketosteroid isomerase-like protein